MRRSQVGLIAGAAALAMVGAFSGEPILLPQSPAIKVPVGWKKKRKKKKCKAPNPKSLRTERPEYGSARALARYFRADLERCQEPSIKAKLRHKWFRRKCHAAALRIHLGQQIAGDERLVRDANAAGFAA